MLYGELMAVCSEIHTKHTNTLCGQNLELLNFKPGGTYSYHWAPHAHKSHCTALWCSPCSGPGAGAATSDRDVNERTVPHTDLTTSIYIQELNTPLQPEQKTSTDLLH